MIPTPSHTQRASTARAVGETQMNLSFDAATASDPSFGERAYAFIVGYIKVQSAMYGSVPGEQVTLAAQAAGIGSGRDGRAFGAVYAKAIRQGAILDAVERAGSSGYTICAWGAHKVAAERAQEVLRIIRMCGYGNCLWHLGLNKDGSPKHPLYVAASTRPKRWAA